MKKILFLIFILSTSIVHAQNMQFTYDNAGNRISRIIVVDEAKPMASEFQDVVLDTTIKFHFDNVQQILSVEVSGKEGILTVYKSSGEVVLSKEIDYGKNYVSTSTFRKGIYIFRVKASDKESFYKVYIK